MYVKVTLVPFGSFGESVTLAAAWLYMAQDTCPLISYTVHRLLPNSLKNIYIIAFYCHSFPLNIVSAFYGRRPAVSMLVSRLYLKGRHFLGYASGFTSLGKAGFRELRGFH